MKLTIRNLAKIAEAEIEFSGITVIGGANDTGKSTVGKALFAMFHVFRHMEESVRWSQLTSIADAILQGALSYDRYTFSLLGGVLAPGGLAKDFQEAKAETVEEFLKIGDRYVKKLHSFSLDEEPDKKRDIEEKIKKILAVEPELVARQLVTRGFRASIGPQIQSLLTEESADVCLGVQGKDLHAQFVGNTCQWIEHPINLVNRAVYIDDPYTIDHLERRRSAKDQMQQELARWLRDSEPSNTVTEVLNQQALQSVLGVLEQTVPGQLYEEDGRLLLRLTQMKGPLYVESLSTGVKAFAILKRLLQNHQIGERDVLILDEPEIHLHPEWQMLYAQFLVLLQKAFHLTVLLTSHSPYFLNAIEVYVKKYGVAEQTRYYFAKNQKNGAVFENVTHHVDTIYASLARPFEKMEALEEELELDAE